MDHDHGAHANMDHGTGGHDHGSAGAAAVGGMVNEHMMMHPMTFHFGSVETILFGFWKTETAVGIFISSVFIVALCFLLEFLRWYRLFLKKKQVEKNPTVTQLSPKEKLGLDLVVDLVLHAVYLTIGYILMLIFMTFNIWLCAAVVVGEVAARAVIYVFFPDLDILSQVLSANQICCG